MTLKFAIAGLAALAGISAAGTASAAMPNGLPSGATQNGNVENVRLVCDVYGRCFRTAPRFYGGGPRFYGGGGYGYGRPRFYGGGGGYGYGGRRHFGGGRRW